MFAARSVTKLPPCTLVLDALPFQCRTERLSIQRNFSCSSHPLRGPSCSLWAAVASPTPHHASEVGRCHCIVLVAPRHAPCRLQAALLVPAPRPPVRAAAGAGSSQHPVAEAPCITPTAQRENSFAVVHPRVPSPAGTPLPAAIPTTAITTTSIRILLIPIPTVIPMGAATAITAAAGLRTMGSRLL